MSGAGSGVVAAVLGLLALLLVVGLLIYRWEMAEARERIEGGASIVESPFGPIQFSRSGEGAPVLVIHGAGGGFDQGELIAEAVLGDGFDAITPSRFGYLGSGAPEGASHDDQADALAWLLDHLGVGTVAVVAMSAGGGAGLTFALRYPDRVSSLTLLSAGVAPVTTEDQADADAKGKMWVRLSRNDLAYWTVTRLFRRQVMGLMGAEGEVVAGLDPEEREWIHRIIDYMNPVSRRFPGVVLDNLTPLPGDRISGIGAPTLVVHARDDTLQLFENALFAARTIPGARLMEFEGGGHFVIVIERDIVAPAVREHIREHFPAHP